MKCYYFLCTLVLVRAVNIIKKFCDIQTSSTKNCYLKETLLTISHSSNQLAVDNTTNTLYFSFDSGQGEYVPAVFKIDNKKLSVLKGVKDAFAMAYDSSKKVVYFGGSHGIYKYNPAEEDLKRLAKSNLDVWWLFIKRRIHFIKFPSLNAFYYENQTMRYIPHLAKSIVHQFVFDNNDNVFFINTTGLFAVRNDSDHAISLGHSPKFIGMALDNKGQVYVCSDEAIYVVSPFKPKVMKLFSIQGVLAIAFDNNNNIIYSDSHELVRLQFMSSDKYYNTINSLVALD